MDFGVSLKVHTVHITNTPDSSERKGLIGSHIRHGDDSSEYSTNNDIVLSLFYAGGFKVLEQIVEGRYLTIRRDDVISSSTSGDFVINNIKVYQTPNLIEVYQSSASITSDTSLPDKVDFDPINLLQNLDSRAYGDSKYAIINANED